MHSASIGISGFKRVLYEQTTLDETVKPPARKKQKNIAESPENPFNLPEEIIQKIFLEYIDGNTFYRIARTCKFFRAVIKDMRELSIENRKLNKGILNSIFKRSPKIEILALRSTSLRNSQLSTLKTLKSLTNLDVSRNKSLMDKGILSLATLPLKHLNIGRCGKITDLALSYLTKLSLEYLDISGCYRITGVGLIHLAKLPLIHLKMTSCRMDNLLPLANLSIKTLDISECYEIDDSQLAHLASLPLESLKMNNCIKIKGAGLKYLSQVPLKHFEMSYRAIRSTENLGPYIKNFRSLEYLDLSHTSTLVDRELTHLKILQIKSLSLSNCKNLTDKGLLSLQGLPLQHLDISNCKKITDVGLGHLAGLPLKHLNLFNCQGITDLGVAQLRKLPLERLIISNCKKITDIGVECLIGLALRHLELVGCILITKNSLMHLEKFPLYALRADLISEGQMLYGSRKINRLVAQGIQSLREQIAMFVYDYFMMNSQ